MLFIYTKHFITELPEGRCTDHVFQRGDNDNSVGCYEKLRRTLNSTDASKKTKRFVTICAQCKQSMCLPCFNEKHFAYLIKLFQSTTEILFCSHHYLLHILNYLRLRYEIQSISYFFLVFVVYSNVITACEPIKI